MYEVADRLDPDSYLALATAVYAEMALAGVSCVGEFHYLHHGRGGTPYADPNEMGRVLIEAASRAGIRITLLDTCYLAGGLSADGRQQPLEGPQLRFGDGDAAAWAAQGRRARPGCGRQARPARAERAPRSTRSARSRRTRCTRSSRGRTATARRCTRTCPSRWPRTGPAWPRYRATPAEVLAQAGALGPRSTAVHATHLTGGDIELLGGGRCHVVLLPDHRGRPGGRDRPGQGTGRRGQPADSGQRQPRRHRPAGGGAAGRARRAAGQPGARSFHRGRARQRRRPRPGTRAWAGRRRASSPRVRWLTSSPSRSTRRAPRARRRPRRWSRSSSARQPPTCGVWSSAAGTS